MVDRAEHSFVRATWVNASFWAPNRTADQVELIRKRLVAAQNRQKNYANRRQRPLEFKVGKRTMQTRGKDL